MFRLIRAAIAGGALLIAGQALAQPAPATQTYAPNDYADKANWLCWPGPRRRLRRRPDHHRGQGRRHDRRAKPSRPTPHAPIDCFYVYPTVSRDPGVVSEMKVEPEERNVVHAAGGAAAAPSCRLYAPMYRQFTLTALVGAMLHRPPPARAAARPEVGYNDVQDAWNYYLAHENHGRGVVLVGHSQGSGMLTELIAHEIDGKPAQAQLVSAILMGTPLAVPAGQATSAATSRRCRCATSSSQLGCVIAYSLVPRNQPAAGQRLLRPAARQRSPAWRRPASTRPISAAAGARRRPIFGAPPIAAPPRPTSWLKGTPITRRLIRLLLPNHFCASKTSPLTNKHRLFPTPHSIFPPRHSITPPLHSPSKTRFLT